MTKSLLSVSEERKRNLWKRRHIFSNKICVYINVSASQSNIAVQSLQFNRVEQTVNNLLKFLIGQGQLSAIQINLVNGQYRVSNLNSQNQFSLSTSLAVMVYNGTNSTAALDFILDGKMTSSVLTIRNDGTVNPDGTMQQQPENIMHFSEKAGELSLNNIQKVVSINPNSVLVLKLDPSGRNLNSNDTLSVIISASSQTQVGKVNVVQDYSNVHMIVGVGILLLVVLISMMILFLRR